MTYETKYNVGDTAYGIGKIYQAGPARNVDCVTCENSGKVVIKDVEYACPGCRGLGKRVARLDAYLITDSGLIHVVRVEDTPEGPATTYMLHATSGRVWDEGLLFGSRAEAAAECAVRNQRIVEMFEKAT